MLNAETRTTFCLFFVCLFVFYPFSKKGNFDLPHLLIYVTFTRTGPHVTIFPISRVFLPICRTQLLHVCVLGWNYGAFMCKATPFLQGTAVSASVNTLMAIAFDRYPI